MPPWTRSGVMCEGGSVNQMRSHSYSICGRSSDWLSSSAIRRLGSLLAIRDEDVFVLGLYDWVVVGATEVADDVALFFFSTLRYLPSTTSFTLSLSSP